MNQGKVILKCFSSEPQNYCFPESLNGCMLLLSLKSTTRYYRHPNSDLTSPVDSGLQAFGPVEEFSVFPYLCTSDEEVRVLCYYQASGNYSEAMSQYSCETQLGLSNSITLRQTRVHFTPFPWGYCFRSQARPASAPPDHRN